MRILVVEDEKNVASFREKGLREEGYSVDVAHDGADGLVKARVHDYDLVLLDVMMPGRSGVEVVRELRTGIVGVSMGAIVAATYALRDDWYEALVAVDVAPVPPAAWSMVSGWGAPDDVAAVGRAAIATLVGSRNLEDGRTPVVVCATDLRSGARVGLRDGPAGAADYASSALAGVLPPATDGDRMLADGAYAAIAHVDLARPLRAQEQAIEGLLGIVEGDHAPHLLQSPHGRYTRAAGRHQA